MLLNILTALGTNEFLVVLHKIGLKHFPGFNQAVPVLILLNMMLQM